MPPREFTRICSQDNSKNERRFGLLVMGEVPTLNFLYDSLVKAPILAVAVLMCLAFGLPACHATTAGIPKQPLLVQPGPPGAASHVISVEEATDLSSVQATKADVEFMQGMIHHHLQAIDMTTLLAENTQSVDMRKLGLRMSLSQSDEINMMRRWLEVRGQHAPGDHANHMPGAPMMPGMLSPGEMQRLAAAKGEEFDMLFLRGMIKHHTGALAMVDELFKTEGAGQQSEIFAFATDVEADQRADIDRMTAMLMELTR
jgi:uncharacterized protein (DUF305 family)